MGAFHFKKLKQSKVKAMLRHCDKEERPKHKHSNKHIDVSKSHTNKQVFNLDEAYKRFEDRVKYLDETTNKNKRKNRVPAVALNIKPPYDFPKDQLDEFFYETIEFYKTKFGEENFINAYIHSDEIHEFTDAETGAKKVSLPEVHFFFVPEQEGGLNASELVGNSIKIGKYHKEFEKFVNTRFNVKFHTGEAKKTGRTAEELKNLSETKELKQSRLELAQIKSKVSSYKKQVTTLKKDKTDLTNEIMMLESNKQQITEDLGQHVERIKKILAMFDDVQSSNAVDFDKFVNFCDSYQIQKTGKHINTEYFYKMKKAYDLDKQRRASECKERETSKLNEIVEPVSNERRTRAAAIIKQYEEEQQQTPSKTFDGLTK